jgi:hypothetical protein
MNKNKFRISKIEIIGWIIGLIALGVLVYGIFRALLNN